MSQYAWTISGGTIINGNGTDTVIVTWPNPGLQWIAVNYTGLNGCQALSNVQKNVYVHREIPYQ